MSAPIAFLDTETTGLDPDRHQIWEVALIKPDGAEHVWQFPINEMEADPFALNIGHYWDRHWEPGVQEISQITAVYEAHTPESRRGNFPREGRAITPGAMWCHHFRNLTAGLHLVGAVVSFDEERLRRLLNRNGVLHRWHYHLCDVEALAAGRLGIEPPWDSDDLSAALGVTVSDEDRHTALGDAKWAKRIYDAVMGSTSPASEGLTQ
jgi:hypothetical protein